MPVGIRCPLAVFALPLIDDQVAVVRATDGQDGPDGLGPGLWFHFLVVNRRAYESCLGDPFVLARGVPASWNPSSLATVRLAGTPPPMRTVAEVQQVLKRIKAGALREEEDPEAAGERTSANSESPALLGGVQVLVDGGKLVFERSAPDPGLVEGLWMLLPQTTRARLWPTTFAFSNELGFDVIVMPRIPLPFEEGYCLEEHAADYPEGRYELALQTAAEAGDQAELNALLNRRSSHDTLRLAVYLLIFVSLVVLLLPRGEVGPESRSPPDLRPRLATAAAAVAVADPWTAMIMIGQGNQLFLKGD